MFTNVSWQNYAIAVGIILVVWYLIIGLRFYISDIRDVIARRNGKAQEAVNRVDDAQQYEIKKHDGDDSNLNEKEHIEYLFEQVQNLSDKIKFVVSNASTNSFQKDEFAFSLLRSLKEFPELKGSTFQVPINNLITSECEKIGFIPLNDEELVALWREV